MSVWQTMGVEQDCVVWYSDWRVGVYGRMQTVALKEDGNGGRV